MLFQETLEEWLNCQRTWMYLETIFSSPDITKQMPNADKAFKAVDKSWKSIMRATFDNPNAYQACTHVSIDRPRRDIFKGK
jgi:dynein heavy chain